MAVRLKQDRTRRSGHAHSKNAQDFPVTKKTPELCRQQLRNVCRTFLTMMAPWCEGRQAETIARAAVRALVDTLDKETTK